MADNDTDKTRIKRLLFPTRKRRTPKIQASNLWYQKKPRTINIKLRQAILDALPFDTDKEQADLILRTIFNTIVDKTIENGAITIPYIGKFFWRCMPKRKRQVRNKYTGKVRMIWVPQTYKLAFEPSRTLRVALRDEEPDASS